MQNEVLFYFDSMESGQTFPDDHPMTDLSNLCKEIWKPECDAKKLIRKLPVPRQAKASLTCLYHCFGYMMNRCSMYPRENFKLTNAAYYWASMMDTNRFRLCCRIVMAHMYTQQGEIYDLFCQESGRSFYPFYDEGVSERIAK